MRDRKQNSGLHEPATMVCGDLRKAKLATKTSTSQAESLDLNNVAQNLRVPRVDMWVNARR
jgi:hypothetical protein